MKLLNQITNMVGVLVLTVLPLSPLQFLLQFRMDLLTLLTILTFQVSQTRMMILTMVESTVTLPHSITVVMVVSQAAPVALAAQVSLLVTAATAAIILHKSIFV